MKKLITTTIALALLTLSLCVLAEEGEKSEGTKWDNFADFTLMYVYPLKKATRDVINGNLGVNARFDLNSVGVETGFYAPFVKSDYDSSDFGWIIPVYVSYKKYFDESHKWFYNLAPGIHYATKGDDKVSFAIKAGAGYKLSQKSAITTDLIFQFNDGTSSNLAIGVTF